MKESDDKLAPSTLREAGGLVDELDIMVKAAFAQRCGKCDKQNFELKKKNLSRQCVDVTLFEIHDSVTV